MANNNNNNNNNSNQQHRHQAQPQQQQQQQQATGGRTAFNWHVYTNRRSALLHLRKNHTLADIILQTEDGSASELVHSQVMSAFGDKLSDYIKRNGQYVDHTTTLASTTAPLSGAAPLIQQHQQQVTPTNSNMGHRSVWQQQQQQQQSGGSNGLGERVKSIKLPKLNRYTLHILVECAYTGSICTDLHSGGIWQILELADHYEMQDVIRACCNFLVKNLDQNNCVQFYHVGRKHQHPLMRSAWHTIRANFKHILAENLLQLHLDPRTMDPIDVGGGRSPVTNEKYNNWLASMVFEHYHELLMHDKLNVEREESVWFAIKLWCQFPSLLVNQRQLRGQLLSQPSSAAAAAATAKLQPQLPSPSSSLPFASTSTPTPASPSSSLATKLIVGNDDDQQQQAKEQQTKRASRVTELLPCMRFPRFRTGTEFSTQRIWRDPLIFSNKLAQHQLAVLDRNHRDFLSSAPAAASTSFQQQLSAPVSNSNFGSTTAAMSTGSGAALNAARSANSNFSGSGNYYQNSRDGFNLPCAVHPRQLRPRVPHSILLAIGGWQQGQPTKLIESYDLNCNLWFESKHKILLSLAYHGIENISGILYICGGTNGNDILNEVFTFDPLTGDCHQAPSMREARCYVSTAYLDGFLYAMGGHNGLQRVKSAERLQIGSNLGQSAPLGDGTTAAAAAGQWTHVQDMQVARSDGSACVYGGRIYVAGGLNDQVIESSVEFYNQQDNTWTFLSSMITPRTSFTLLAYPAQDCLLAIGGNDGSERLSSVERFDFGGGGGPQSSNGGGWSLHSNMRHRRSTFSACLLDQTKLIVVGGYNGQTPFNQVEMYDQQQGQWVMLRKMRFDRSGLKVIVVNDLANATDYTYLGNAAKMHHS